MTDISQCPGCGLEGPVEHAPTHAYMEASPYCWRLYGEILAREYNHPAYMAVHQKTVDAYAVQHPGSGDRRAVQSLNLHLVSLCLQIEERARPASARQAMKTLAGRVRFERLKAPANPNWMRVDRALQAGDAVDHRKLVENWALSAWVGWHHVHPVIREMARAAR